MLRRLLPPVLALAVCAPVFAQEVVVQEVVPLADVIVEFKREIADAQAAGRTGCVLRIVRADFRFEASVHTVFDLRVGGMVEAFGIRLGGGVSEATTETATAVVRVALVPDPEGERSDFEVSSGQDVRLSQLILQTKRQIEEAAATAPQFLVDTVVIETGFAIERRREGDLSVAVVKAQEREGSSDGHRLVLALSPPEDGRCEG